MCPVAVPAMRSGAGVVGGPRDRTVVCDVASTHKRPLAGRPGWELTLRITGRRPAAVAARAGALGGVAWAIVELARALGWLP